MPMRLNDPLPSLDGITEWINGEPDIDELKDGPTLVYFWAVSCPICHQNLPKLKEFREKYVPEGLNMISIHCPRAKSDIEVGKVHKYVAEYAITEPCGIDNKHKARKEFESDIWPSYYLFDREGLLKRRAAGTTGLALIGPMAAQMLKR